MFCTKCGKQMEAGARFCINCGYQIKAASLKTSASPDVPAQWAAPITEDPPVQTEVNNNGQVLLNNKRSIVIAFVTAAMIIIFAFVGIKFFASNKGSVENISGLFPSADVQPELPVDDVDDEVNRAKAYSDVVSYLQQKYGAGFYNENGEPFGVTVVREIDFDQDSTPELLCAFRNTTETAFESWTFESPYCDAIHCLMCYEVWGWKEGQAIKLAHEPLLGSMAVDDYDIRLLERGGHFYLLRADGNIDTGIHIAATIQNGRWKEDIHLYMTEYNPAHDSDNRNFLFYNQGEQISEAEYWALRDEWNSCEDGNVQTIPMWYGNAQFSQTVQTIQRLNGGLLPESATVNAAIDLSQYLGDWTFDCFDGIFTILLEDGAYYISGNAVFQNGNRLAGFAPVELVVEGNTATATYEDDYRMNSGEIRLQFEGDGFYATVTDNGVDWSMAMENEYCYRWNAFE